MESHEHQELAELRRLAEKCLASEAPSSALSHELASRVMALVASRTGRGPSGPAGYRVVEPLPSSLVALERCQDERDALRVELEALRARR